MLSSSIEIKTKPDVRKVRLAQVREIRDYNQQIRELILDCEETFSFRAGQFIMLHVPQPGQAKPALRAYSIASSERKTDGFRLIFKAVSNGLATRYVWKLKPKDTVRFTGPFGRVFFKEPPSEQLILLNTGSGVSQHFSYLDSFAESYPQLKAHLVFGVRHETDIYYLSELKDLARRLPNFSYQFALSRPIRAIERLRAEGLSCFKGYVQDALRDLHPLGQSTTVYLCGNSGMIKSTRDLLQSLDFDMSNVLEEAFD